MGRHNRTLASTGPGGEPDVFEPHEEQVLPDLVLAVVGGNGHGVPVRTQDPLMVRQAMARVTGTTVRLLVREIREDT